MKSKILGLLALGLLAGPMAVHAAIRTYDFTANGGSVGALQNVTSAGYFSFDDSIIPAGGGPVYGAGLLTDLSFSWNGIAYDETNANTGNLTFDSAGNLVPWFIFGSNCSEIGCQVSNQINSWWIYSYIIEGVRTDEFKYGIPGDTLYRGSFTFSLRNSVVPEPGTLALLGLGLAGLGLSRRKAA